jgi:hypothetical protein
MTTERYLPLEVKSVNADAGTWTAIASAPTIDRDDEVLEARCFEPLPQRPVPVRSRHFGGEQVGSGRPRYDGDVLLLDGRFASTPKAQEVRTLVTEGHLTSMSVVFLPITDRQVDGRRHIVTAELLAVDWAEIPSNRDSRVLVARSVRSLPPADALEVAKARIAAFQAELALLPPEPAPPSLAKAYADLAECQAFLADLNGR